MAKIAQLVSDLTGTVIPDGEHVELRVADFPKASQLTVLDLSREEAAGLLQGHGRLQVKRGRRPRK